MAVTPDPYAAAKAARGQSGRFFFDRCAVRTHWIPSTVETRADRERLWSLCGGAAPDRATSFGLSQGG